MSSLHTTDRILTESLNPALSCLFYPMISSLTNALEGGCFCLRQLFYKCKQAAGLVVVACFYPFFFILHFVIGCLFFRPLIFFFILTFLLYLCLLVNHVNKPIIFVFRALVYYFQNTISIFVTILTKPMLKLT